MQFVKKNVVVLASGGVALIAIVVMVLGMTDTSVRDDMQKRIGGASAISSLRSDPKNQASVDAETARVKGAKAELKKATEELERINKRAPLVDVFPRLTTSAKAFEFKQVYADALKKLLSDASAGDLPSYAEVEEEQQNVSDLIETERMNQEEGGDASAAPPPPPQSTGARTGRTAGGPTVGGPQVGGPGKHDAAAPPVPPPGAAFGDIKYDATRRAVAAKAKSIRVWANEWALHRSPILEQQAAPALADMWYAQMTYWIEADVINAIKQLNDEAAAKAPGGEGDIETSPVKRLERLRVFGYIAPDGKVIEFPAMNPSNERGMGQAQMPGPSDMRPSFTLKKPDEQFDVVRFVVYAVVDQRDVNAFIDRICRQNFYVCVYVEIGAPDMSLGHAYGTDPVCRVTLDFEGYFSRKAYAPLMPPDVAKLLGINPPQPSNP